MRSVWIALIGVVSTICGTGSAALAADAPASKINFNADWRFIKEDKADAKTPTFDDSTWAVVSCPHTYNDVDTFDDYSLAGHRGEQNQFGGRTWYRKTFTAPAAWQGKKIYIEFEAARQVAEVYLNGELLGTSKTGFTPFGFDLTPHLKFGGKNVIAVMCDNRFMKDPAGRESPPPATNAQDRLNLAPPAGGGIAEMAAKVNAKIPDDIEDLQADQIPWNNPHWHPAHGGIYRDVYLHVLDPLHISLPLYSFLQTAGPYVYCTDVSDKSATVNVEVPVQNDGDKPRKVEILAQVLAGDGTVAANMHRMYEVPEVAAGKTETFNLKMQVPNPQLWDPAYPYLYRLSCTIRADGRDTDKVEIPFGIRTVKFDAATGFWINGHHLKLHGWGQKPTDEWPGLGAAQPDWMHWFTLNLMKSAGGNWVRWGHCAGGPAQIRASDELGVMVEQPGLDGEHDTRAAAWKLRTNGFRDVLIYYRNSPAIMIWEAGNQTVTPEHAQEMKDLVQKYDPHGGRAFAFRRTAQDIAKFETACIGTEGGREIKSLPVIEGEYDREESPRRVWDDASPPNFGYPEAKGMTYDLTSEEFAVNQVEQWIKKCGAPDHCGGSNWIFSDSTSGGRVPAEVDRAGGEVDGVRLPKEAYYVCSTMFRGDPQVHVIGHWSYPAKTTKNIYVVSNGDEVELFVNGKSLGKTKAQNRYLFAFHDVKYDPGEIKAVAYLEGKQIATDSRKTIGEPKSLKLTPITGPGGLLANGSDVALIDVEVVDANGERCPTYQDKATFTCTGEGIWRGGYNSGKIKSTNNTYLDLEAGINRIAVRSTLKPGKIVVEAAVQGLPAAKIEIESHPANIADGMSDTLPALPAQEELKRPTMPDPRLELASANKPVVVEGKLITGFSYSGPKGGATIKSLNDDGDALFSDRDVFAKELPGMFKNKKAEYIQLPCADVTYSALDLIQFTAGADVDLYIAHDTATAAPKWLTTDFTTTGNTLTIANQKMAVYKRSIKKNESLTLGGDSDDSSSAKGLMYLVIAVPK